MTIIRLIFTAIPLILPIAVLSQGGSGGEGESGGNTGGTGNINNGGITNKNGFRIDVLATGTDTVVIPKIVNGSLVQDTFTKDWQTGAIKKNGQLPPIINGIPTQWVYPKCKWTNLPNSASGSFSSIGSVKYTFVWEAPGTAPNSIWAACTGYASVYAKGTASHYGSGSNGVGDLWTVQTSDAYSGGAWGTHLKNVSISQSSGGPAKGEYTISVSSSGSASGHTGDVEVMSSCGALPDNRAISFSINGGMPKEMKEGLTDLPVSKTFNGQKIDVGNLDTYSSGGFMFYRLPRFIADSRTGTYQGAHGEPAQIAYDSPVEITGTVTVGFLMPEYVVDSRNLQWGGGPTISGTKKRYASGGITWINDGPSPLNGNVTLLSGIKTLDTQAKIDKAMTCGADVQTNHVHHGIEPGQAGWNGMPLPDKHTYDINMSCDDIGRFKGSLNWEDMLSGKVDITVTHIPCAKEIAEIKNYDCFTGLYRDQDYVEWNQNTSHQLKTMLPAKVWEINSVVKIITYILGLVPDPRVKLFAAILSGITLLGDIATEVENAGMIGKPNDLPQYFKYVFDNSNFVPAAGATYNTYWAMSRSYTTNVKMVVVDKYAPLGFVSRSIGLHDTMGSGTVDVYYFSNTSKSGRAGN